MALPNTAYRWRDLWVNGTTYYNYDVTQSPLTLLTYVLDNGNTLVSIVDPSLDPLWKVLNPVTPVPPGLFTPAYGSFSSTQSQPFQVNPLLTAFSYTTIDIPPSGISLVGALPTSIISPAASGVYKVLTSLQLDNNMGNKDCEMFPVVNGLAIPNSATRIQVGNNIETVMTVEYFLQLNAGDQVEIQGTCPVAGPTALAIAAAPPVPAIPSIITTITRIA